MTYVVLLAALLPVAILLFYIYKKDKFCPEPTAQLEKAFVFGVLSVPLSLCVSVPLHLLGLVTYNYATITECIGSAFLGAAIPEESAKLFMLWLFLRKNKFYDEKVDGIVYAVCISLGFAALENIIYIFGNLDSFVWISVLRAMFAVPGHFCFGIMMGYYYSLAKFYPQSRTTNKILILAAPIFAHGVYDSILFVISSEISALLSFILMIVFLVLCCKMWKLANRKINEHLERDRETLQEQPECNIEGYCDCNDLQEQPEYNIEENGDYNDLQEQPEYNIEGYCDRNDLQEQPEYNIEENGDCNENLNPKN